MDYDTASEIWFWALVTVVPLGIAGAAVFVGVRRPTPRARLLHFTGGLIAAILLALGGPWVAHALNPPPFDPAFAGGRGLDLRGIGNIIGAWAGAALAFAVTVVAAAALALQSTLRARRARRGTPATATATATATAESARSRQDRPDPGPDVSRTGTLGG